MTARDKFRVNQTVKATGLLQESFPRARSGIVRGFGRQPHLVRVQREGLKSVESYHMDFWEPVQ